jgi:hypothetical protein
VRSLLIAGAILVACAGLMYLLFMSPYAITIIDKRGPSESIHEARERGVYLFRYKVLNPDHYINDSTELHIKEAWIERPWRVGTFYHQTIQCYDEGFVLCLIDSTLRSGSNQDVGPDLRYLDRYFRGFTYRDHVLFYRAFANGHPQMTIDIPIVIGDFKKPDTVGVLHLVFEDGRPR